MPRPTLQTFGQRAHDAERELLHSLSPQLAGINPLPAGMALTLQALRTVPPCASPNAPGNASGAEIQIEQDRLLILMVALFTLPDSLYVPGPAWPWSKREMLHATLQALREDGECLHPVRRHSAAVQA